MKGQLLTHDKKSPFVIAELSANHNGSLDRALQLVDAAAAAGADAIKLQTYTPETMTLDLNTPHFVNNDEDSLWFGRQLFSLYKEAQTPWKWHEEIFNHAKLYGLEFLSSPFDESAADFLEKLSTPIYKIASFECIDLTLIRYVARKRKPMIISTGMARIEEIGEAVAAARAEGNNEITILHCTSAYPAHASDANLGTILDMKQRFGCAVGVSDHTLGSTVAVAATALGASVIEKHLTLSRADGGPDSGFSTEPSEFKEMVAAIRETSLALGHVHYGPTDSEQSSLTRRRSLYIAEDMKSGDPFNRSNLRRLRPGFGLPPKFFEEVLGKRVVRNVKAGTPLSWKLVGDS